ncbi:MAG: DUF1549 and DUF1553 domain-containing protein [Gemmataceae bacterium]|nr:DUF1549 and DUF1553 domain-containing protein [Gemmataceae bacterium]
MAKVLLRASCLAFFAGAVFFSLNATAVAQSSSSKTETGAGFGALEEPTKLINKRLGEAWDTNKITPAERCSDHEFIRRASLDIIGRIAKVEEIEVFLKDPPSVRRQMLVDRLLKSPEYQAYWATIWTNWLMTRTGTRLYKDQIHLWLEELYESEVSIKDMAEKLVTATGKTNANGAVNYILANLGGSTAGQGRNAMPNDQILRKEGQFDMVPITSRTVRLFLGYQIQCTQCHDHPFNADWKQKHFWGVNAFFRQTQRVGAPAAMKKGMPTTQMELADSADYNKTGIIFFEKRNGVFLPSEPIFLDGSRLPKSSGEKTRREILAQYLTGHKNFSRAYVNRMWAHLFSRGMNVKPAADDFGEHNEVVHDELLTELGDAFVKANYNPKAIIRWIAASEAYNLKATANKTNDTAEAEPYMSRMMLKSMSPEQLFESLMVATRRNADAKQRADWMGRLTTNFGDDEGNEATFNGTVVQALLMMNGRDMNEAISRNSGTVEQAMKKKSGKETMDYLFLAALNRPATQKEYTAIVSKLPLAGGKIKDADAAGPLQDVFWALLNCSEFILNH